MGFRLNSEGLTIAILVFLVLMLVSVSFPGATHAQLRPVVIAPGFEFNPFADPSNVPEFSLGSNTGPSCMAFDHRGRLFVGTLSGKILILLDNDDDGRADEVKTFATRIPMPLGLEFHENGDLFATSNVFGGPGRVLRLRDIDGDDVADEVTMILDGLPSDGDHQTNRLKFGPDGLLYIGQGSSTDNGTPNPSTRPPERALNATIFRIDVNDPAIEIVATGLRNPFGIAFNPVNGELFSTDGSSGEICQSPACPPDLSPPDEVNWVVNGGNYGFPMCEGTPDPGRPGCANVRPPIHQFPRHLTPTSLAFYTGPQAGEFENQLLITLYKNLPNTANKGGDLRRLELEGDAESGFRVVSDQFIAQFEPIDPFDGPVETAIDPLTGDIYVARLDVVRHADPNEHHHFIYRIHRAGSDALPFIGPLTPASVSVGSGPTEVIVLGRHLKPGAVVLADGLPLVTRQGSSIFELIGDLPAAETMSEREIDIEVLNPDGGHSNIRQLRVVTDEDPDAPQISLVRVFKQKKNKRKPKDIITAGSNPKKLRLWVTGDRFAPGAQLLVNGDPLEIIEASETEMIGLFTRAMVASPGELMIQIQNPNGSRSNIGMFVIMSAN